MVEWPVFLVGLAFFAKIPRLSLIICQNRFSLNYMSKSFFVYIRGGPAILGGISLLTALYLAQEGFKVSI